MAAGIHGATIVLLILFFPSFPEDFLVRQQLFSGLSMWDGSPKSLQSRRIVRKDSLSSFRWVSNFQAKSEESIGLIALIQ